MKNNDTFLELGLLMVLVSVCVLTFSRSVVMNLELFCKTSFNYLRQSIKIYGNFLETYLQDTRGIQDVTLCDFVILVWYTSLKKTQSQSGRLWTASGGVLWFWPQLGTGPGLLTPLLDRWEHLDTDTTPGEHLTDHWRLLRPDRSVHPGPTGTDCCQQVTVVEQFSSES